MLMRTYVNHIPSSQGCHNYSNTYALLHAFYFMMHEGTYIYCKYVHTYMCAVKGGMRCAQTLLHVHCTLQVLVLGASDYATCSHSVLMLCCCQCVYHPHCATPSTCALWSRLKDVFAVKRPEDTTQFLEVMQRTELFGEWTIH